MPGSILEIEFDSASRGASVQFLSVAPHEDEFILPPASIGPLTFCKNRLLTDIIDLTTLHLLSTAHDAVL